MADELPPVITRLLGDISDLRAALAEGTILVKAFREDVQSAFAGAATGERIGGDLGNGIDRGARDALDGGSVAAALAPDGATGEKIVESGRKTGDAGGKAAGGSFAAGMSPLITGALLGIATVGPAAILTATAGAVLAAGALITKNNQQLQESYRSLAQSASASIQDAAAPLIPELYASVQVLDQGVARIGPELKSVFAAVAPDATELTGGLVSLVGNTLPGLASGLRSIAPEAKDLSADLGKLGTGVGDLFQGLGTGAAGATTGFNALTDDAETLLADVGKLAGSLSGGLGPALHDISDVAIPVANAFTDVVDALPPRSIEAAAIATTALFAAFKVGTLTGIVAEGTSFMGFLTSARIGEVALTAETETTSLAMRGMGLAMDAALGPLGLIAAGMTLFGLQSTFATGNLASFTAKVQGAVDAQKQHKQATDQAAAATAQAAAQSQSLTTSLSGQQQLLTQSAVNAGNSAIAALSFAGAQDQLNGELATTIDDYNLASGAASAYKTASDALFGKYQSYSDAQATFTTDLDNAAKGLKAGKDGFDVNTASGSANYKLMSTLATANENRAEALLKETGSQDKANASLRAGALALDATAKQAHFTQGQIDALNIALYGTKNIGDIQVPIGADTSMAYVQLHRLVNDIDNTAAYVQVGAGAASQNQSGSVGGHQLLDVGGWVDAPPGAPVPVTAHGREYMLSLDMLAGRQSVDPTVLALLRSGPATGSGQGSAQVGALAAVGGGASGGSVTVVGDVYLDGQKVGRLVTPQSRSSALQYKTRNSQTGFN